MSTTSVACACGVRAASAAPRCKVCPVVAEPVVDATPTPFTPRRVGSALPRPVIAADDRQSRWAKSENSFGPFGRVMATIGLLVPVPFLVAIAFLTFIGIVGAGIYVFVIVPWALRDIWKKTKISSRAARR